MKMGDQRKLDILLEKKETAEDGKEWHIVVYGTKKDLEECEERLLNNQIYLDAVYNGFLEWKRHKNEGAI